MDGVNRPVRQIRTPVEELEQNFEPNPSELGTMTWKDALDKKLIKPGMTVNFSKPTFQQINIGHDEAGIEQSIDGKLLHGIVIEDTSSNLYIVALAELEPYFVVKGRFGRVFGFETLKRLRTTIYNETSINQLSIIEGDTSELFLTGLMYSKFFNNYYVTEIGEKYEKYWIIGIDDKKKLIITCGKVNHYESFKGFHGYMNRFFYGIMYFAKMCSQDIICLSNCNKISTNQYTQYGRNFFDKFITV